LFEADLKKSKLMSGVQKIILKRLEEERDEELPTLYWFIVKPGLLMTVF
jgi:phenylalanine-4-hydroxylase